MPWDVALSSNGDLIFSPGRDWQTCSGEELLRQRILLRLKIHRGSWIFDESGDLGSQLDLALQMQQPDGINEIPAIIEEALEPMSSEINIVEINVEPNEDDVRAVDVSISYQLNVPPDDTSFPVLEVNRLRLTVPAPT